MIGPHITFTRTQPRPKTPIPLLQHLQTRHNILSVDSLEVIPEDNEDDECSVRHGDVADIVLIADFALGVTLNLDIKYPILSIYTIKYMHRIEVRTHR